ncbi:ribosomal protein S12 methylthiotransferase accessory factor [Halalkaliarchaeum desulfuricum]|uniref:Ribosomal protein S12 methylthiotransferase accessory factor n=1 Tax=Halalkaliarchaeum desulfuricum TaxID=2055893 RepID=A0A343THG2_9EURY|nr:YcaO-like family protein [Halalkaliarchaeum desulfuricum]AUX08534.1 ribosomal protein S12 methylthiotransferase accessory factor [Halalkaliarchaeum desulfuricum]
MDIAVVGDGPAADAAEAGLADVDANVFAVEASLLDGFDRAIVVGTAGDDVFETADAALDRWIAVEIGGLGGHPLAEIDAAVTLFDRACYDCLRTRVAAGSAEPVETARGVRSAVRYAGAAAARRLIRALSGDDLGDTVLEEPGGERRLLPAPGCECTEPDEPQVDAVDRRVVLPDSTSAAGEAGPPLEDALGRAERAVDDRIGPVSQVGERESFPIPYYVAAAADTREFSDARAAEFAGGADTDWNRAFMKALGEGLERYCAGVYRGDGFRTATTATLREEAGERVVAPEAFVTPEGYRQGSDDGDDAAVDETDEGDSRPWVRGTILDAKAETRGESGTEGETEQANEGSDESSAWLPAESVFYPPVERRLKPAITTGLGLGNSTSEAVLSGLYEVLERDATMLAWYSTFDPLELEYDGELADLRKRARAESLAVSTLLVTQDVDVPVVAAAVHRDPAACSIPVDTGSDDWPAFAAGSGAALDPVAAARSALSEALQNWTELRAMGPERADEQGGAIGRYAGFPAEVQAFVDADASVPAETLGEPELSGRAELQAVLERLETEGLGAYAARTTTRDVAALGFEGVRVVVPEAQPLFTGDPFFGERARAVPETMGFEPRLDREYHPFP